MKKCTKCGKTFDDDAVFCTSCGERLVSGNACPRCGNIISEDDAFCGHCGYNLKQGNKCSKCGAEIKEGNRFCSKCGEPINDNQYIAKGYTKEKKAVSRKPNVRNIFNYVLVSIFFLVTIIAFIGFFGDIVTLKGFGEKESVSISYFFGEGAEQIKSLDGFYKFDVYYSFRVIFFVIYNIFYFGGFVGFLVVLGFGLTKGIFCLVRNELFPKKYFLSLIFCVLPYVMLTTYMMSLSTNISLKYVLGWGTALLAASIIICAICFVCTSVLDSIKEKKNVVASSLFYSTLILIVFMALYGITKNISIRQNGVSLTTSPFIIFSSILLNVSVNGADSYNEAIVMGSFSFVFSLIPLAFLPLSMGMISIEKKVYKIITIALLTIVLVFSIVSSVLGSSSLLYGLTKQELANTYAGLGAGGTISLIFALLGIGSLIGSLVLQKE